MRRFVLTAVLLSLVVLMPMACGAFVIVSTLPVLGMADAGATPTTSCSSGPLPGDSGGRPDLGPDYRTFVAAGISVGREMGIPERGWIVIVATGIQESRLRALDYGDTAGPDSRGWLQQRAAWGPLEMRMDPSGAARLFYGGGMAGQRGLLQVEGWEQLPITVAAQRVQGSALPTAYAKWEGLARELVAEVAGMVTTTSCAADTAVQAGGYALPLPKENIHLPIGAHHDGKAVADLAAPIGVPIFAMVGGTVRYTTPGDACGLGMEIVEPSGSRWMYCHSSERLAADGATVKVGDVVAKVGSTGHSTGPHLHLQIFIAGANHCPQPFITALMGAGPGAQVPDPASYSTSGPCV